MRRSETEGARERTRTRETAMWRGHKHGGTHMNSEGHTSTKIGADRDTDRAKRGTKKRDSVAAQKVKKKGKASKQGKHKLDSATEDLP